MTYEGFSIRGAGLALPFGRAGVSAVMAALLALVGLLLPTGIIEAASFQLYLDALFPAAVPPFGWTAHVVAAICFAIAGAAIGWLLGWFFRVGSNGRTFRQLLDKLRGIGAEDEADAPELRAADRHPDAPARRPFSVSTDMARNEDDDAELRWPATQPDDTAPFVEDELLLDAHYSSAADASHAEAAADDTDDDVLALGDYPAMTPDSALADPVEPWPAVMNDPADDWADAIVDDQEALAATAVMDVGDHADEPDVQFDNAAVAPQDDPPAVAPQPIDLSVGRLDELLARLEAGLAGRAGRGAQAVDEPAESADNAVERTEPATDDHPVADASPAAESVATEFQHDPALAAALATLRRMNQHVG